MQKPAGHVNVVFEPPLELNGSARWSTECSCYTAQFKYVFRMNKNWRRDQVVHLDTAANLCASRLKQIIFSGSFSIFDLGSTLSKKWPRPLGVGETKLAIALGTSN